MIISFRELLSFYTDNETLSLLAKGALYTGVAILGAGAVIFAAPVVLATAGGYAARMMAAAAVANGGAVGGGSTVAVLQVGAAGLGALLGWAGLGFSPPECRHCSASQGCCACGAVFMCTA